MITPLPEHPEIHDIDSFIIYAASHSCDEPDYGFSALERPKVWGVIITPPEL